MSMVKIALRPSAVPPRIGGDEVPLRVGIGPSGVRCRCSPADVPRQQSFVGTIGGEEGVGEARIRCLINTSSGIK